MAQKRRFTHLSLSVKTDGIFHKFDTVSQDGPFYMLRVYMLIFQKNIIFLSLKTDFVLANSADLDEMPHYVTFHLSLHCLPMYPFRGFQS